MNKQHIVLIGFKHVGKSVVAQELARLKHLQCIDLDKAIERSYLKPKAKLLTCRQLMKKHGEAAFRQREALVLSQVLQLPQPCVIATGGGTPLEEANQALLKTQQVVYITAPRELVFERIMRKGKPAFFPDNEDPWVALNRFWEQREPIYRNLATIIVENRGTVTDTIDQILSQL